MQSLPRPVARRASTASIRKMTNQTLGQSRPRFRSFIVVICILTGSIYLWRHLSIVEDGYGDGDPSTSSNYLGLDSLVDVDGMVYTHLSSNSEQLRLHPIPYLMRRADRHWAAKLSRQSKTVTAAASEYRKRYGRHPPRGFKQWSQDCLLWRKPCLV